MKKKRTQFIKWFNGNDLLTPAPSMSCSLKNSAVLLSCREMGHEGRWPPGEAAFPFHTALNPNLITPVLFHPLLALVWCQSPECILSSLRVWVLGTEEGCGDLLQRTLWGETTRAEPSWGFCWPQLLSLAPDGQDNREGICPFWDQLKPNQSVYNRRNAKTIPHKSSTCSSACRHINLKSSGPSCKPSTVTASD